MTADVFPVVDSDNLPVRAGDRVRFTSAKSGVIWRVFSISRTGMLSLISEKNPEAVRNVVHPSRIRRA